MRKNVPVSKKVARVLITIVIILVTLVMIVPFVWMISASFKTEADVMKIPIEWIPKYFYIDNYKKVLSIGTTSSTNYHFPLAYFNSIKVAVISTVVAITSATLAGYAFAKLKFKGSNVLFIIYLAQMMVPSQLTLIPRFVIFSQLPAAISALGQTQLPPTAWMKGAEMKSPTLSAFTPPVGRNFIPTKGADRFFMAFRPP